MLFAAYDADKDWVMPLSLRMKLLLFELIVQRNKHLLKRLYGKACTKRPDRRRFSFEKDLIKAVALSTDVYNKVNEEPTTESNLRQAPLALPFQGAYPDAKLAFSLVSEYPGILKLDMVQFVNKSGIPGTWHSDLAS